ncbi:MAG: SDR family oxidoreductase [Thermoleophilia bacterium]
MSPVTPRRILITGNLGYVGPRVVSHLSRALPGAALVGIDAGYFAHGLTGVDALPERALAVQHYADVRAVPDEALAGVDAVVHLAAISNDPIGNKYEDVTLEINHRASVELARRARDAGVRSYVFASSCSVYGTGGDEARTEASEVAPLTAYARSKVVTERDVQELADDRFVITCLRFATACGWSERLRLDLVLNDFVASAVSTGAIVLLSDGTAWRPLIHVDDMARAIEWGVTRDPANGGPFVAINAGSDAWNYRIRELAEAVGEELEGVRVEIQGGAAADKRSYRVDFGRYRELAPDHQPRVSLQEAVRGLRDGLARMGFADADFRASGLIRLRTLEGLREQGLLDERLAWTSGPAAGGLRAVAR